MNFSTLTRRSLTWFWRTNAAVTLGVAVAVAVLTGALLVGDSVRGSLRDLVLERLGETDLVVVSTGFFREDLALDLAAHPDFEPAFDGIVPIIVAEGFVTLQTGDTQAGQVRVYGVDDRFGEFHGPGRFPGSGGPGALLSPALAAELGVEPGDTILVRIRRPTDLPADSVFGEKENLGETLRTTFGAVVPRERLGEFSLQATQGDVRAVFLPLDQVQQELGIGARVNTLLVSEPEPASADAAATLSDLVRDAARLADLDLRITALGQGSIALESREGLLADPVIRAADAGAEESGLSPWPVFTYLANGIADVTGPNRRSIPYSLITAIPDLGRLAPELSLPSNAALPPILLTDWAAADLGVRAGDTVEIEYFLWEDPGRLLERTARFEVVGMVPVESGDPDLAPTYPGITDSTDLADWDPPFPIDLGRIRPEDEDYWDRYRTTPKAYIPLDVGQQLWGSRHGSLTSIRFEYASSEDPSGDPEDAAARLSASLRPRLDPLAAGLTVAPVRSEGVQASLGAVNFGEYFVYFSFFLVVSALLLAALFFKLNVEQRAAQVGLLRAVGFTPRQVRRSLLGEGLWISVAGVLLGVPGGIAYAWLIVTALGTWWIGAVGTSHLTLHVAPLSLAAGAAGGIAAALVCIRATLHSLSKVSERRLLSGQLTPEATARGRRRRLLALALGLLVVAGILILGAAVGVVPDAGGFFGAGTALLAACLSAFVYGFQRPGNDTRPDRDLWPVARLGVRNLTWRPARSVVPVAMIASATFILISVDAFRTDRIGETGPDSGIGGYSLIVETLLPVVYDPASPEGRDALGLAGTAPVRIDPFGLRPGDDASCLNLYAPRNPRILAPTDDFIGEGRFAFSDSLASSQIESENPWLLLHRREPDGAIPVIADQNSITYVLNRRLGDDIVITEGDRTLRLRLVAALDDSIFQGEILMSDANFREVFPDQAGYGYLLVEDPVESDDVARTLGRALGDHGARITSTVAHLSGFHQVENTYLSTFQALGAMGLLLGTFGLGAILLRNVFERRKELALLRALGYRQSHFYTMTIAENGLVLVAGLAAGTLSALLAIAPAVAERGGRLPGGVLVFVLAGVLGVGLITSLVATAAALRSPLLPALRSE